MVSCGAGIIKILLGVFNLLWLLLGGGIIFIGVKLVTFHQDISAAADLAKIDVKTASFVILAVGVVIALIAFLGFFGACCESSFMLNAYGFLMLVMIGGQIYVVVTAIRHNSSLGKEITDAIQNAIADVNKNPETRYLLEEVQYNLKCCGWNGASDYSSLLAVPASCCHEQPDKKNPKNCNVVALVTAQTLKGCKELIPLESIENLFKGTIGVGIAIILFELVLVFAACCLAREVK